MDKSQKVVGYMPGPEIDLLKTREQLYLELTHERVLVSELLEALRILSKYPDDHVRNIAEQAISKAEGRT